MDNLSKEIQKFDFLIVSDSKNANPTVTLIYQLVELHDPLHTRIHLIVPDLIDVEFFETLLIHFQINANVYCFDSVQFSIPEELFVEKNGVSKIAYAKIFAPTILPSDVNKVVYLDTDILILRPLNDLFELDLEFSLAASIDASDGLVGDIENAFNSGVMVMNLTRMRQKWDDNLLVSSFKNNLNSHWMDMTILRSVYKNDWHVLPTSYNYIINGTEQDYSPELEISLIHFAGGPKPWFGKSDSLFFVLWVWLSKKANQIINGEKVHSGLYRALLQYGYPEVNEMYHQLRSGQIEYSLKSFRFQLAGTQAELAGTQAELTGTQAELAGTQAELAGTQAELTAVLKSRIWRFFGIYRKFRSLKR
jgi:lipopolysaccharide biosynthesis glycosyltransferase